VRRPLARFDKSHQSEHDTPALSSSGQGPPAKLLNVTCRRFEDDQYNFLRQVHRVTFDHAQKTMRFLNNLFVCLSWRLPEDAKTQHTSATTILFIRMQDCRKGNKTKTRKQGATQTLDNTHCRQTCSQLRLGRPSDAESQKNLDKMACMSHSLTRTRQSCIHL
jgi:hypothetical protein